MAADEVNTELEALGKLARAASSDFANLASVVRAFGRANPLKETFVVSLKQARQLLKESGGNINAVRAALKGAGASGRDLGLIMRQLNSDLDKARKTAMSFESVWQRIFSARGLAYAAHAVQALGGGFSALKTVMGGPLGLAKDVIGKGIDLGKGLLDSVVEAAEFRQNALTGMSYMLGGDMEKARGLFADAQKMAQETPLDTDKVIKGIKTFLTQGFSADQSKFLYKVVADQASKFLDEPETERNVVTAFSRLQGRGYATAEDIESFRVANFQGSGIFKQLLMQPGMKELMTGKSKLTGKETEEEFFKKIKGVLGTGLVGKGTLMNAVVGSMYEGQNLSEGPGSLAKKFGQESLTGALSNAKNAFGDMLKSMDLVKTKGFTALMKVLGDYSAMLTAADGPGKKLRETVEGLVNSFLGGLSRIKPEHISRAIDTVGKLAKEVMGFFERAWGWLSQLLDAKPGAFLASVKDVLIDVGSFIGQGIWKGVKMGAIGAVGGDRYSSTVQGSDAKAWGNLWTDTGGEAYRSLMGLGPRRGEMLDSNDDFSSLPSSVPRFAEGAVVDGPTLGVFGEKGREFVVPENRMPRGGTTVNVYLSMMYAGSADSDDLAAALQPVADRCFANVFSRLAMES